MLSDNRSFTTNNNFNLVRTYLSLNVVFFHCHELSGRPELDFLVRLFNGETAVEAFFIISGFLVMESYGRSYSTREFLMKRLKRLYPAYLTIILLCAVLGCLVSTHTATRYFTAPGLYSYIASNLFFLNFIEPSLPGVFTGNPFTAVNGSLWTIKIEVGYYLLVPLIVFIRSRMNAHVLYAILFLSSLGYYIGMKYLYNTHNNDTFLFLARQIPGQLFYFILGAWATELKKTSWFMTAIKWLGVPCAIIVCFSLPVMVHSLLVAVVVFFFAYAAPAINYPYKKEDISYGLYIYHFPVIQVLVYYGLFGYSAYASVLVSLAITVGLAAISWIFIEKPFIVKRPNEKLALN